MGIHVLSPVGCMWLATGERSPQSASPLLLQVIGAHRNVECEVAHLVTTFTQEK